MKAFSDIEQSKKLAEILPHDTADGTWKRIAIAGCNLDVPEEQQYFHDGDMPFMYYSGVGIPSWSLAALLDILPILDNRSPVISKTFNGKYRVVYHSTAYERAILTSDYDNPVDACVAMIEKLNEQKLL